MVSDRLYEGNGAQDGGNGLFIRRHRRRGWEVTDRLYGAVGEKSIDFSPILYRLFTDTSVHPLGQYGNNDLFVWEHRSFPSVGKSAQVRRCGTAHA